MTTKQQPGGWTCPFCYGIGRHMTSCESPVGQCARCGKPFDDHEGVRQGVGRFDCTPKPKPWGAR